MTKHITRFLSDESGATAIEYGLIAALVSIAAVTTLQTMGQSLATAFGNVSTVLSSVAGSTGGTTGGTTGGSTGG